MNTKYINEITYLIIVVLAIIVYFEYQSIRKQQEVLITTNNKVNITNRKLVKEIEDVFHSNIINYVNNYQLPKKYQTDTSVLFLVVKFPFCEDCVFGTIRELQKYAITKTKKLVILSDISGVSILKKDFYFENIKFPIEECVTDKFSKSLTILFKKDDNTIFSIPLPNDGEKNFIRYYLTTQYYK